MKLLRLAVLGAAAYGVKKWLDQNPDTKRQVKEAADTAKARAQHAAEQARHEVDRRRHKTGDTLQGTPGDGLRPDQDVPTGSVSDLGTGDPATPAHRAV